IASKLKWNEEAKIYAFRAGLRDELKDLLVGKTEVPAERLSSFANYMISLDNSWQARQMEKKSGRLDSFRFQHRTTTTRNQQSSSQSTQNPFSGNRSTTKDGHYPRAMELDGAQRGKKLTDAQRNYRRANNLCMYCGKPGHFASNCNANPNKGRSNVPFRGKTTNPNNKWTPPNRNSNQSGSNSNRNAPRRFGNSATVQTVDNAPSATSSRPLYSLVAEESKN